MKNFFLDGGYFNIYCSDIEVGDMNIILYYNNVVIAEFNKDFYDLKYKLENEFCYVYTLIKTK